MEGLSAVGFLPFLPWGLSGHTFLGSVAASSQEAPALGPAPRREDLGDFCSVASLPCVHVLDCGTKDICRPGARRALCGEACPWGGSSAPKGLTGPILSRASPSQGWHISSVVFLVEISGRERFPCPFASLLSGSSVTRVIKTHLLGDLQAPQFTSLVLDVGICKNKVLGLCDESDKGVFCSVNEVTFGKPLGWGQVARGTTHMIRGSELSVPPPDLGGMGGAGGWGQSPMVMISSIRPVQ